jgi:hypothetical protein
VIQFQNVRLLFGGLATEPGPASSNPCDLLFASCAMSGAIGLFAGNGGRHAAMLAIMIISYNNEHKGPLKARY